MSVVWLTVSLTGCAYLAAYLCRSAYVTLFSMNAFDMKSLLNASSNA